MSEPLQVREPLDEPHDPVGSSSDARPEPRVPDRSVLLLLVAVVAVVLGADALSALLPGADRLFAGVPLVVVLLVAVTGLVLLRTIRRGAR